MEGGIYGLCGNNKAQCREGQNNLQVGIASQECARNKVVTGALLRGSKNCGVQKFCRRPEALATRQRPNIGKFGDADEGSAKAEGIGKDGYEKCQPPSAPNDGSGCARSGAHVSDLSRRNGPL